MQPSTGVDMTVANQEEENTQDQSVERGPAPGNDTQRALLETVRVLAEQIGPRPSAGEGERLAAAFMIDRLRKAGYQVELEPFAGLKTFSWTYALPYTVLALAGLPGPRRARPGGLPGAGAARAGGRPGAGARSPPSFPKIRASSRCRPGRPCRAPAAKTWSRACRCRPVTRQRRRAGWCSSPISTAPARPCRST